MKVRIVGGGLAGCEAAWQAAQRGVPVEMSEMRPRRETAVHRTDQLAELVCSNSFRADKLDNAVGLLKEEMRRLGSLVMTAAEASRVPAGAALAVDRVRFSEVVTQAIAAHPLIRVEREEVGAVPAPSAGGPVVLATGPLTSDALAADVARLVGAEHLFFYDAISPIVLADTIDMTKVFRASRWNRNSRQSTVGGRQSSVSASGQQPTAQRPPPTTPQACGVDDGGRRLFELSDERGGVQSVLCGAHLGGVSDGSRFRSREVF